MARGQSTPGLELVVVQRDMVTLDSSSLCVLGMIKVYSVCTNEILGLVRMSVSAHESQRHFYLSSVIAMYHL